MLLVVTILKSSHLMFRATRLSPGWDLAAADAGAREGYPLSQTRGVYGRYHYLFMRERTWAAYKKYDSKC